MNYKLKYGTPQYKRIVDALKNRIRAGARAAGRKASEFAKDEERFRAYIHEKEIDAIRKNERELEGKPRYTTIEVPYSYAILMSFHTYMCSVFLSSSPVLQFMGRHGESEQQTQAVEAIMDYQTQVGAHLLVYFIWLLDMGKYGVGIVGHYWEEEIKQISVIEEVPLTYLGIKIGDKIRKQKTTKRVPGYQGNKMYNIRPQDFLFDSRVALSQFQEGEFCGRFVDISWNTIKTREALGQYYNIDILRKRHKDKATPQASYTYGQRDTGSSQLELPETVTGDYSLLSDDLMVPGSTAGIELSVRLIPKDWGLGASDYPEVWNFTLAATDILIESAPAENIHGKYPYDIMEYEIEGYALSKRSMFEIMNPLQDAMTWLLNSHFYNVRNTLNGQFVIDPMRVTMSDFGVEGGGRLIRLKQAAYGTNPSDAIHQLITADVTQNHMRDMTVLGDMMQRVSGVTDNLMGMVNQGGRKTATEIRSSNVGGSNRLKIQAEFDSAQGFQPLAQKMLQNTQQFYDAEKMFRIAGDLMVEGQEFVNVTPEMIAGQFDLMPVDGSQPVDKYAQVTMWTQLLGQIRTMPEVAARYDMARIVAWVAGLGGIKNLNRFKVNVIPDNMVGNQMQQGNLIPIGGPSGNRQAGGQAGTRAAGVSSANATGVSGASQSPGMGPTG